MVVDDDADARELLSTALSSYGAIVTAAASAMETFELLPEVRPDVLLSDIAMYGEDGYSFLGRVRSLPGRQGTVPAIAVTAYAAAADRERALNAGYQHHVSKPFDHVELARQVQRLASSSNTASSAPTPAHDVTPGRHPRPH
jgi:CheY-like chemotaxis protein